MELTQLHSGSKKLSANDELSTADEPPSAQMDGEASGGDDEVFDAHSRLPQLVVTSVIKSRPKIGPT